MNNIAGYGTSITIRASVTFPQGLVITQLADDADPIDVASTTIAETGVGLNGHMVVWSKATPLSFTINPLAGSSDEANLSILFDANRVDRARYGSRDVIDATVVYPDGSTANFSSGVMTEGVAGTGIASAGRLKTKPFKFVFESKS